MKITVALSEQEREKLTRQPVWVQQHVQRLERRVAELEAVLSAEGRKDLSDTWLDTYDTATDRSLPAGARIRFYLDGPSDNSDYINRPHFDVRARLGAKRGYLEVYTSGSSPTVVPQASNVINVYSTDF